VVRWPRSAPLVWSLLVASCGEPASNPLPIDQAQLVDAAARDARAAWRPSSAVANDPRYGFIVDDVPGEDYASEGARLSTAHLGFARFPISSGETPQQIGDQLTLLEAAQLQPHAIIEYSDAAAAYYCDLGAHDAEINQRLQGLATMFHDRIHTWELLNEPNGDVDPTVYGTLLAHASATIKGVDPSATVLMAGLANRTMASATVCPGGMPWQGPDRLGLAWAATALAQALATGGPSAVDGINIHPFAFPYPPDGYTGLRSEWGGSDLAGDLEEARRVGESVLPGLPVWVTELAYPSAGSSFCPSSATNIDPELQADYLARSLAIMTAHYVERIGLAWIIGDVPDGMDPTREGYPPFGCAGLYRVDGTAKPSAAAVRFFLEATSGARFASELALGPDDHGLSFANDAGATVIVLWGRSAVTLPVAGSAALFDRGGAPLPLTPANGSVQLQLGDSPVYLVIDPG
jgi:hypothetical protein